MTNHRQRVGECDNVKSPLHCSNLKVSSDTMKKNEKLEGTCTRDLKPKVNGMSKMRFHSAVDSSPGVKRMGSYRSSKPLKTDKFGNKLLAESYYLQQCRVDGNLMKLQWIT